MTLRNLKRRTRALLGARAESMYWRLVDRPKPSFAHKYAVQRQVYLRALERSGIRRGELWGWETKEGHRAIAEELGLATPRILVGPASIDSLEFASLPDCFVLKPVTGGSGNGVFVLRRDGETYLDLVRGGVSVSEAEVKQEIRELDAAGLISGDAILIEEALLHGQGPVNDWKVYAFQGETPLVLQIERSPGGRRSSYYDGHWRRLGQVRWSADRAVDLPRPQNPEDLLEAASRVSKVLPVPFARIDLYEAGGTVYLGEITAIPGSTQRYSKALDLAMGEAWERAEEQLVLRNRNDSGSDQENQETPAISDITQYTDSR